MVCRRLMLFVYLTMAFLQAIKTQTLQPTGAVLVPTTHATLHRPLVHALQLQHNHLFGMFLLHNLMENLCAYVIGTGSLLRVRHVPITVTRLAKNMLLYHATPVLRRFTLDVCMRLDTYPTSNPQMVQHTNAWNVALEIMHNW